MSGAHSLQLVLLVPGLFGPLPGLARQPGAAAALLSGLDTTTLETLLARARRAPAAPAEGIEACLFDAFGVAGSDDGFAVAALTRQMDAGDAGAGRHLRADPVHLQAGMDEATLLAQARPAPGLAITAQETPVLLAAVNEALADDGLAVEALAPGRWYLRLPEPSGACLTSLYDVAGGSLREAMPGGPQGARWRRLLTTTQTALFACPLHHAREAAGAPPVNSLWFFGEGVLPPVPTRRFDVAWSDHELGAALAAHAGASTRPMPADAATWLADAGPGRHLLLFEPCLEAHRRADHGGWCAALELLQRSWLAPLATALRRKALGSVTLNTGDGRVFVLTRGGLLRFWHRPRPLTTLAPTS